MNFIVNHSNIQVTQEQNGQVVKIGSLQDSCCNTNLTIKGVNQPVVFENEKGKGGFINKQTYVMDLIEAFKLAYKSDSLRVQLSKLPVTIKKIRANRWLV